MFVTHGPLPPDSRLFVGRTAEMKRMETWLSEVHCVGAVLGARQTGKTSLLLKLRHAFREKYAFAFVDLQTVEGAHAAECFGYIAEQMVEQLAGSLDDVPLPEPKDSTSFAVFLREFSKRARIVRIIVILDEIGSLPQETAIKLAGTIRAVFTARFIKPEFAKFNFLLAGATDMLELTTGKNSPLGNVTEKIYLGDLSLAETGELLNEVFGDTPMGASPEINRQLHTWTSGHPYWTQLLAAQLEAYEQGPTEERIRNIVEELLRSEATNLPHLIRSLRADNALWLFVESLLDGLPVSFSRANAAIARLEMIGILKDQGGNCIIRNRIYQEAMHRHRIKPVRLFASNLRVLAHLILTSGDINSLLTQVPRFLQDVLQSRSVVVYTKRPGEKCFHCSASVGVLEALGDEFEFEVGGDLLKTLEEGSLVSTRDFPETEKSAVLKASTNVLVPLRLNGEVLGFLGLGGKLSGEQYDSQDQVFLATVGEQVAAGIDRTSLQELKLDAERALEIQRGLLPKEIFQIDGYEIACAWQPARTVSGDYYDVLKYDGHRIALCIGDVVGKGMPAALLMASLQAAVRVLGSVSVRPDVLCEQVNRLILSNIAQGKFITFFYGLVDSEARRMTYTNAGHNPPIVVHSDKSISRLEDGGALLGVFPEWKYRQGEIELSSGDRLLLFTDGVSEAQDQWGNEFGEERLVQLLKDNCRLSAGDLQRRVIETVTEFSNGNFHDDVTLLAMTAL